MRRCVGSRVSPLSSLHRECALYSTVPDYGGTRGPHKGELRPVHEHEREHLDRLTSTVRVSAGVVVARMRTWRTASSDSGVTDGALSVATVGSDDAAAVDARATRGLADAAPTAASILWRRADAGERRDCSWMGWRHGPQSDTLSTASPSSSSTRQSTPCSSNSSSRRTTAPPPVRNVRMQHTKATVRLPAQCASGSRVPSSRSTAASCAPIALNSGRCMHLMATAVPRSTSSALGSSRVQERS